MVDEEEEKTDKTDDSTEVTSMESEIGASHLQSSHSMKKSTTHGCLSPTTIEPITSPFHRPISPSVALSHDRVEQTIREGDHETATIVHPHPITVIPSLLEEIQDQEGSVLDEAEWEIVRIVGKRRRGKGYEYKVCWKKIWLLERELGNAQELLKEFEAKRRAQRGGKTGKNGTYR